MRAKLNVINCKTMLLYLIICISLVVISYYFIDKPLARWIYLHRFYENNFYTWITFIPNTIIYLSVILSVVIFLRSQITISQLKQAKLQSLIIGIAFSGYISIVATKVFKFFFGRMGPEYWVTHHFNLTAYGFYPLHGNALMYQDFPSGHTAASFAIISVICCAYPKFTWLSICAGLFIIIALLFTQSHYFADCIGGAFLGAMLGLLTARFFELLMPGSENK